MNKQKLIEKALSLGLEVIDEKELKGEESRYRFKVKCLNCGSIFSVNYYDIMYRNRICRFCKDVKMKRYQTKELLIKDLKEKCKEKNIEFDENDVKTTAVGQILPFKCTKCGNIRKLSIHSVLSRKNAKCAKCIGTKNRTNEEKIAYLQEKAKKCDYTILNEIIYTNRDDTKIQLRCNKCGFEWQTSAGRLISECKCLRCSSIKNNTIDASIKEKKILERCEDTPYQFLGWTDKNSIKTHSRIDIKCTKHNMVWHPTYKEFVQSFKGCPMCANEVNVYEQRLLKALRKKYDIDIIYQYHNKEILGKQSFDFYIPKYKIAIELQGEEHFVPVRHSKNDSDEDIMKKHNIVKERDKKKYNISKNNNINLLYFSYSARKYIPNEYLDTIYLGEKDLFNKIDLLIKETKKL